MIPLNQALACIAFVTALFSVYLSLSAFKNRRADASALPLFFVLLTSALYMGGYGWRLLQTGLPGVYRALCLEYLGVALIPTFFVWLGASFSVGKSRFRNLSVHLAFALSVLIWASVLTDPAHHLYFASVSMDRSLPFPMAAIEPGPLSRFTTAYYLVAMSLAIVQYARRVRDSGGIDWQRMSLFIAAFALGIVEQVVYLSDVMPWHIDVAPFFLLLINALVTHGIMRKDIFDVGSIARKLLFEATKDAILVLLPDRTILDANPAVRRFFPRAPAKLAGLRLDELSPDLFALCERLGYGSTGDLTLGVGESVRCLAVEALPIAGEGARKVGMALIIRDVTATKRDMLRLEELAIHDGLTDCFTRRHWLSIADTELLRFMRSGREFGLVMIDIDHFKEVNDTLGHAAGDLVLRSVTQVLAGELRSTDYFGRVGGEEFAVLLPETDAALSLSIAERLRAAVERMGPARDGDLISDPITISLGVTVSRLGDRTAFDTLRRADEALYDSKRAGRNRVTVAPSVDDAARG